MDIASRFRNTITPSIDQLRAGQSSVVQPITDSPRSLVDRIREQQSFFSTVDSLPNNQQVAAIDSFRNVDLFPKAELPSFVKRRPVTSNIENIVEVTERDDPIEELETKAIKKAAQKAIEDRKAEREKNQAKARQETAREKMQKQTPYKSGGRFGGFTEGGIASKKPKKKKVMKRGGLASKK